MEADQELREMNDISVDHRRFATTILTVSQTTRFRVILNLDDRKRAVILLTSDDEKGVPTEGTDLFAV